MIFHIQTLLASARPTTRSDIHFFRKFWHAGMIFSVACLYEFVFTTKTSALFVLLVFGGGFSFLDIARLWNRPLNKFIISLFAPVMRKRELNTVSATTPFIFATAVVIACFSKPVAILALLCLAFGDVAACMVGLQYGKDLIYKKKSLQGTLACFIVCALLTLGMIHYYDISTPFVALLCFIGGLAPTLAELFATKKLDDNFLIPISTAFAV